MHMHTHTQITPDSVRVSQLVQVAQMPLGSPALALPANAVGRRVPDLCTEGAGMVVEWDLSPPNALDMASSLADAVLALLRVGPDAGVATQGAAAAALALLVHAPAVHDDAQLWQFMPNLSTLVELLPLCAKLPSSSEQSLLLLALKLLASLSLRAPQQLAALQRSPILCDASWLPIDGHARHASMLLQTIHTLASISMAPCASVLGMPRLGTAYALVAKQLLPTHGSEKAASTPRAPGLAAALPLLRHAIPPLSRCLDRRAA